MLEALWWGLVAGCSLIVGAALGLATPLSQRTIGLVMGFGAGVLVSALAFDLTTEAHERGGAAAVALGLVSGGFSFFAGDWIIDQRGGAHRKRSGGQQAAGSATAIMLGALMDGIPESAAIGVSLLEGEGVGIAFVAAVFLSNVPESLSAATGMRKAGQSARHILGLWATIMLASGLASLLGFALIGGASDGVIAFTQTFAAGAILTMLADTIMPEAFEDAGPLVGLVTALGFTAAFLLSTIE